MHAYGRPNYSNDLDVNHQEDEDELKNLFGAFYAPTSLSKLHGYHS